MNDALNAACYRKLLNRNFKTHKSQQQKHDLLDTEASTLTKSEFAGRRKTRPDKGLFKGEFPLRRNSRIYTEKKEISKISQHNLLGANNANPDSSSEQDLAMI
jgi:hypothetical protein